MAGCGWPTAPVYKYTNAEMNSMLATAAIEGSWYYDRDSVRFVTNLPHNGT